MEPFDVLVYEAFASLSDPQTGNAKRHNLLEVLTIALPATVCGAESCSDFADFAVDREDLFGEFLRLVTANALHCQEETARSIRRRGGDYLLRLKANHPAVNAAVTEYFADPQILAGLAKAETTDADHGRFETQRAWVSHDLDWRAAPSRPAPSRSCCPTWRA